MQKLKELASKFKYELWIFASLLIKPAVEALVLDYTWGQWLVLVAQSVLIAAVAGAFMRHFSGEAGKKLSLRFVAAFMIWYFSMCHYTLYSLVMPATHGVGILVFLASVLCLCFKNTPVFAVPLSIIGVIASGDYSLIFMPSLVVASAFSEGGFVCALSKKKGKKKAKKASGKLSFLAPLAKLVAPALVAVQLITAWLYFTADEPKYGRFIFADSYFFSQNAARLVPLVIMAVLIVALWKPLLKNNYMKLGMASSIAALLLAVLFAFLFDFTNTMFVFYAFAAVIGQFFIAFVLAARSDGGEGSMKNAVLLLCEKRVKVLFFASALCVFYMARFLMLL